MRWLFARHPGDCVACGQELAPAALWCGGCGARVEAGRERALAPPAAVRVEDHVAPDGGRGGRGRRRAAVVAVVLLVLALVAAGLVRRAPARPLLGTTADLAGMTATGPPPSGLRVAWEEQLGTGPVDGGVSFPFGGLAIDGHLLRFGHRVVDTRDGRLVRLTTAADPAISAHLRAGQLVLVDTVTGAVVDRVAISGEAGLPEDEAVARIGAVSAFMDGDGDGTILIRDDGAIVARVDGTRVPYLDRMADDAVAMPLRTISGGGVEPASPVRLVGADGAVVAEFVTRGQQVVDVVGGLALVASTTVELGQPGPGAPWSVALVDARTGAVIRDGLVIPSGEAPRLLGTAADGRPVLASRVGRELTIWTVAADGAATPLRRFEVGRAGFSDAFFVFESPLVGSAAVTDGVVVVLDGATDRVVGIDAEGATLWDVPSRDTWSIVAADGHVALVPGSSSRGTPVLRAADGSRVTTVRSVDDLDTGPTMAPIAMLDGAVGVAQRHWNGTPQLSVGSSIWLDPRTGEHVPVIDLLAQHVAEETAVSGGWTLHGTRVDPTTGEVVPVVTRDLGREHLQLLQPDGTFAAVDLGLPDAGDTPGYYTDVIGAAGSRLAVQADGFEDPSRGATYVVDADAGGIRRVPGVVGFLLLDDVLLGVVVEDTGSPRDVVAIDPATGEERWSRPFTAVPRLFFGGQPGVDAGLLVMVGRADVMAIDLADGDVAWTVEAEAELRQHVVLTPRHVVVATGAGELLSLDREDGSVRWRAAVGTPLASMTGVGEDTLVGTVDGLVVHIDADGREVQRIAVGTSPVTTVASTGDTVLAVTDGRILGLRTDGDGVVRQDEVPLP